MDPKNALAIQARPGEGCTVSTEGSPGSPSYTDFITADNDGLVRFYAPPPSWGSKLRFSCGLPGGTVTDRYVDLNDESTFAHKPAVIEGSGVIATSPPLSSDQITGMSTGQLVAGGYPVRPDRTKFPDQYAKWLKIVTQPFDVVASVGVAPLGGEHAATLRYNTTDTPVWSAIVQDTAGFTTNFPQGQPNPLAQDGQNYFLYAAYMGVPPNSCATSACATSFWAGLGGYPTAAHNPFNGGTAPLLQSGVSQTGNGSAGGLFVEFVSAAGAGLPMTIGTGGAFNVNDEILVEGWTNSNLNCSTIDGGGVYGCFMFWDITQNWSTQGPTQAVPPGVAFEGATMELAAESQVNDFFIFSNETYLVEPMEGIALDHSGNGHAPVDGEPYIFVDQIENQGAFAPDHSILSYVTFNIPFGQSIPDNDPQSEVFFDFKNSN